MPFRSFAALSLLVSAVWAQSSNPYIPSNITPACSSYLSSLNSNTAFTACTNPFTTALQQFAPNSGATPSTAAISIALASLCQSDAFTACPQSTITAQLGDFYAACPAELTSNPVIVVKTIYDVLYSQVPLRQAMCAKDDSGNYCVTKLSSSSSSGSVALVDPEKSREQALLDQYLFTTPGNSLVTRDVSNVTTALVPNITTYQNTNLLFLFLKPSMPSSTLCTTCTRNIMTPYITFESACPYAPGLANSLLLAGQVPLYANITNICGLSFLNGAVQAAGGLSSGLVSGAAPIAVGQEFSAAVAAILGIAAFVATSL
ncbi:hypothetical protein JVT61DRAFT_14481 [Boletus reticuloceps]|uniref:DUF7729 domain-containing protein n=1 Tax=Boletus reticuloceps TaxID=495285 RepID=A0A8I2YSJ3_9AGAM|nr:hypothetical protein JVT61DRAFT_14481 [Boletus reticuloceps]